MNPFLKWAGGKRWLAATGKLPALGDYNRYIEPFLGGAAVFFHLAPRRALLSDLNKELVELYVVMRDQPSALHLLMKVHQKRHSDSYYYSVRESIPPSPLTRAARFLYLNRTCWNGLYRVNLRGEFNVPRGTKDTVLFGGEDFRAISARLKSAIIECCDFEHSIDQAMRGDLVFVDPPYTVKHNLNGFNKYNERLFRWDDQIRLRDAIRRAAHRGVSVIMTNADHASVRELYDGVLRHVSVGRASVLAGDAARRGPTTESIYTCNL